MSKSHLHACPACHRHVRVTELACPFCGGALDDSFHATPVPVPLTVRLSRAALWAIGTGTLSLAAACGGATTSLVPTSDAGNVGEGGAGQSQGMDASYEGYDGSNVAPPYGISPPPPPDDAGTVTPADASDVDAPDDASYVDAPFVGLPYGAPPYGGAPQREK
jgi:hypothetical protein